MVPHQKIIEVVCVVSCFKSPIVIESIGRRTPDIEALHINITLAAIVSGAEPDGQAAVFFRRDVAIKQMIAELELLGGILVVAFAVGIARGQRWAFLLGRNTAIDCHTVERDFATDVIVLANLAFILERDGADIGKAIFARYTVAIAVLVTDQSHTFFDILSAGAIFSAKFGLRRRLEPTRAVVGVALNFLEVLIVEIVLITDSNADQLTVD